MTEDSLSKINAKKKYEIFNQYGNIKPLLMIRDFLKFSNTMQFYELEYCYCCFKSLIGSYHPGIYMFS